MESAPPSFPFSYTMKLLCKIVQAFFMLADGKGNSDLFWCIEQQKYFLSDKTKNAGILAKRFSNKYNKKQLKNRKICIKIQRNAYMIDGSDIAWLI